MKLSLSFSPFTGYNNVRIGQTVNAAFRQISQKTCQLESESLMTTLQSLTSEASSFGRKEKGLMAVRRGRVAYVFRCKERPIFRARKYTGALFSGH